MNMNHLAFIVGRTRPDLQTIIALLPHLSVPASIFLLASLPEVSDFARIADFPPGSILPQLLFVIRHGYSEDVRSQLLTTALQIVRLTNSLEFFNRITTLLFTTNHGCGLDVVALYVDVAQSFKVLQIVLSREMEATSQNEILCDFLAEAACIATDGIDITATLFKLLSTQDEARPKWELAAACVALYLIRQSQFLSNHVQAAFDLVQSMKSSVMRSIFTIILSEFFPVHLRAPLIGVMKQILFPSRGLDDDRTVLVADYPDTSGVPLLLRIGVAKSIASIATAEQLAGLPDPLLDLVARSGPRAPRAKSAPPPVSPFIACSITELSRLAAALAYRSTGGNQDVLGVKRPFVAISPPFHALTVEIASVVSPVQKSVCLDLRISGKGIIPSIAVIVSVSEDLTPPMVPQWHVKQLTEGVNVTRRFCFTVESPRIPLARIHIQQEDADILDIMVCLPLIDLFVRAVLDEKELERAIWEKLKYEQEACVDLDDALWLASCGCIAVKNRVARASKRAFLAMLPSATVTRAVIDEL
jgi:hypothetical protein